ncbi:MULTISPECIES: hypothetical protein [unclassified Roseibium]|uniref:hypothetical protein n=1 Tax=unclassified Roseibium TaxID=2629323 RepID=UPI0031726AA1
MEQQGRAQDISAEAKKLYAESAARSMEELVERVTGDKGFTEALSKDPRTTLEKAGIKLEKEAVELLIAYEPERFDKICDKLFDVLDPDFLAKSVSPSCDGSTTPVRSTYTFRQVPTP